MTTALRQKIFYTVRNVIVKGSELEVLHQIDPHLVSQVVTNDENFVYGHDSETKHSVKLGPSLKKNREVKSSIKSLFTCFFDTTEIIQT